MKQVFVIFSVLIATALASNFINLEPSIVGGSNAPPHAYPFMVSIHWVTNWPAPSSQHSCGGALLNHLWVLTGSSCFASNFFFEFCLIPPTAAHCLTESPQIGRLDALFGNHAHSIIEPGLTRIEVNRTVSIIHPDWVAGGVGPEDMALLYLITPVTYGATIRAISLPQPDVIPTGRAMAAGWGSTGPLGE